MNKCSLKIFFELLTQPFNIPQSAVVPPYVYDAIFNTSTGWLLSKIAEIFPYDSTVISIAEPFLESKILVVKNGQVELPKNMRNFIDVGAFVQDDFGSPCGCIEEDENELTDALKMRQYRQNIVKNGCVKQSITVVDITQFDLLTKSSFDNPTLDQPIGVFFGDNQLKICPSNIEQVEIRYLRNEKMYRYGYITQPDDTFIFDTATSVESEWKNSAFSKLYKCAASLLGIFIRDSSVQNFSNALKDVEF